MVQRFALLALLVACGKDPVPNPGTTPPTSPTTGTPTGTGTGTATGSTPVFSDTWTDGVDVVEVTVDDPDSFERAYTMSSTHPQRDGWPSEVAFVEEPGQPLLRSGNLVFDALFALAMHETRLLSVSSIDDGAFDSGNPVPCECFQTGAEWHYVWTRDTAYAVDLGLALIDPERAVASLDFKLSGDKPSVGTGGLQIVQDTGSGGSWPVSTDRVVWALGASRVLSVLDGPDRDAFRDRALEAAVNTAEADRLHVYDPETGLYTGESSFLDWREQTYPQWTATDVLHVAESQALSTNAGHWALLDLAARLSAEVGDTTSEARYRGWADQLAADIEARFWVPGEGYARVLPNRLDTGPLSQFDWLGTTLAALTVADPAHAAEALGTYPHGAHGPPVIWPQQPLVPIYHNRAIWPFVTAYGVRAGVRHGNDAVVARGVHSLARGALLNLSNMENLEVLSGANYVDDGAYSGPVVNSHYQLWSVAGYLSMVFDVLGVRPEPDGLHIEPFVPEGVAADWLSDEVTLQGLVWKGKRFDLTLELPASGAGPRVAASIEVDGVPATAVLSAGQLGDGSRIRVVLEAAGPTGAPLTEIVDDGDFRKVYAPRDPAITALADAGGLLELTLDASGESGVVFDVWRDGTLVATDVSGPTWVDPGSPALDATSPCYAVASTFPSTGHTSQRSQPICWWSDAGERVQVVDAYHLAAPDGGDWNSGADPFWNNWGDPTHTLTATAIRPEWTGPHLVQVVHANGAGPINTGITAAHKWLVVRDGAGAVVAEGALAMPQSGDWTAFRDSTSLQVDLDAGDVYSFEVSDAPNMSRLGHFTLYTGGLGGGSDAFNRADVQALKLLPLTGLAEPAPPLLVAFDGVDDLNKLGGAQTAAFGATLQPWEAFALDWDADNLYVAWVSQAFEDPYAPFVLYVEAAQGAPGAAVPTTGLEYSALTPELPFTPTHALSMRNLSDDGSTAGPWDGVQVPVGPDWVTTRRLRRDREGWLAADLHTLSATIPLALLGDPTHLRLAGHVVNAVPGSEWVDTLPSGHTPWAVGGGTSLTIDLTGPHDAASWIEN